MHKLVKTLLKRGYALQTVRHIRSVVSAVFAYANHTPFEIATPGIYEAAIVGAQAFLLLGLLFAFDAVWRADAERPPPAWLLLAAGASWALSIGSRVSTVTRIRSMMPVTRGQGFIMATGLLTLAVVTAQVASNFV